MKNENSLVVQSMDDVVRAGKVLAESNYFKDVGSVAQATAKVMAGVELGIPPMAAITGVHVIKGKTALGASLIASQIQRSNRFDYKVIKHDEKVCHIDFFDISGKTPEKLGESIFTLEDAKNASLLNNDNWKKYPKNMLFARAISNGAKWYTPAVFGGAVYTPDELNGKLNDEGETLDVKAEVIQEPETIQDATIVKDPAPMTEGQADALKSLLKSNALTEDQAAQIRESSKSWDSKTATDRMDRIVTQIKAVKEKGVSAGQIELLNNLMDQKCHNEDEIGTWMDTLTGCETFGEADKVLAEAEKETIERYNQLTGENVAAE